MGSGSKEKCIHRLRWYSLLSQWASLSVVIFGLVSVALFISPNLIGVKPESIDTYQGSVTWLIFGLGFVFLGIFFNIVAYRWPRILLRILRTQAYTSMRLQVKAKRDSNHTQYYAYLTETTPGSDGYTWRIGLWAVSREIERWLDRICSAKVYRDSKTGYPAVIELEDMYLWAMRGEVKRI